MQVKTSRIWRSSGLAYCAPCVASSGRPQAARQLNGRLIARFLRAVVVALQFDVNIFVPIDRDELFEHAPRFGHAAAGQRMCQRTFVAAGQANQPVSKFSEIVKRSYGLRLQNEIVVEISARLRQRCRIFGRAQLHASDQATEVLIPSREAQSRETRGSEIRLIPTEGMSGAPVDLGESREVISAPMCALSLSFFAAR